MESCRAIVSVSNFSLSFKAPDQHLILFTIKIRQHFSFQFSLTHRSPKLPIICFPKLFWNRYSQQIKVDV